MCRVLLPAVAAACSTPHLTRDGQVVFSQAGSGKASVVTANGIEIVDSTTVPKAVTRRSAFEPWQPPTGFLLPADGILRGMSEPVAIQGRGLAVILRPSDQLVPSWGGELLLRLDVMVPPKAFSKSIRTMRQPRQLVVVLDDDGFGASQLIADLLDSLGGDDWVVVVDAFADARPIVPPVPATHRTLIQGSVEQVLWQNSVGPRPRRHLARALHLARRLSQRGFGSAAGARAEVIVLTDGLAVSATHDVALQAQRLRKARIAVTAVGATDRVQRDTLAILGSTVIAGSLPERRQQLAEAWPRPGATVLRELVLSIVSLPAATHILQASGGSVAMLLDEDHVSLGDLHVGQARTEILRLAVPEWVPEEPYVLEVTAQYRDVASGRKYRTSSRLKLRYSDHIVRIANQRNGDVIAYASALAMVRRLERGFIGEERPLGRLRALVQRQASSMALLAEDLNDPALESLAHALGSLAVAVRR